MHPEILSLCLFMLVTSCSPGPNNIVASYSAFNYGLVKTIPHMFGVIFGFTTLVVVLNFGFIKIFLEFPIIQEILKYTGSIFLVYLSYKIAFSRVKSDSSSNNPVKFIETFFFQFLNPKGVIVAIIMVSTYVESGKNFINHSSWVIGVAFFFACFSIMFWTLVGKFLRKFATNEKFIKRFNYVMSFLLVSCIATFYL